MDQKKLLESLSAPSESEITDMGYKGTHEGTGWNMDVSGTPESLSITLRLHITSKADLRLVREKGGDWTRAVGYSKKIMSGVAEFDDLINILATDPRVGKEFVSIIARRDAAIRFFRTYAALDTVVYFPTEITFEFGKMPAGSFSMDSLIAEAFTMAEGLEKFPKAHAKKGPKVLVAVCCLSILVGIVLAYFDSARMWTDGHVWKIILPWGGGALGLLILVSAWVEQGYTNALSRMIFNVVLGALGIFLVADNAGRMVNIRLDRSTPVFCEGTVVKLISELNKTKTRGLKWKLKIAVPELGNREIRIPCSSDVFHKYALGDKAVLARHSGAFGQTWWEMAEYTKTP